MGCVYTQMAAFSLAPESDSDDRRTSAAEWVLDGTPNGHRPLGPPERVFLGSLLGHVAISVASDGYSRKSRALTRHPGGAPRQRDEGYPADVDEGAMACAGIGRFPLPRS